MSLKQDTRVLFMVFLSGMAVNPFCQYDFTKTRIIVNGKHGLQLWSPNPVLRFCQTACGSLQSVRLSSLHELHRPLHNALVTAYCQDLNKCFHRLLNTHYARSYILPLSLQRLKQPARLLR